jgi:CHAT domain-containing protein/tetratricopeptide (TPR) repeat protein
MPKTGRAIAILLVVFSSMLTRAIAQSDPYYDATFQWLSYAYAQKWDLALHSAENLRVLIKNEYGEGSPHYSLVLSGILGQTYYADKRNDSAIAYYRRGMDLFRLNGDTTSGIYKTIKSQFRILSTWQTEDTLATLPDSAMIQRRLAMIKRAQHYSASDKRKIREGLERWKDSLSKRPRDTSIMHYMRVVTSPMPAYAVKAMIKLQRYMVYIGIPDPMDDDYLTLLFDQERWRAHIANAVGGIVTPGDGRDTLSVNVYEYLYAGVCLLKKAITDQQEKSSRQIVYNLNFREDEPDHRYPDPQDDYGHEGPKSTVERGRICLTNKQYARAEGMFRQEIKHLWQTGYSRSDYMQQSLAGLSASLIGLQRYGEAADSLMILSRGTFSNMSGELFSQPEHAQVRYKKAMTLILDMLYTCLCHPEPGHPYKEEMVNNIFKLQLQLQDDILDNLADSYRKARDTVPGYSTSLIAGIMAPMKVVADQHMLPLYKRDLDMDSLEMMQQYIERAVLLSPTFIHHNPDTSVDIRELSRNQVPGTANIEYIRFNYKKDIDADSSVYGAFVFRQGDKCPAFLPLCSGEALDNLLHNEKGGKIDPDDLSQKLYDPSSPGAAILYKLIWAPLEPYLDHITNINYSTAGLLNDLSMNAVYTGRNYLMNSYSMHRFLRLRDATYRKNNIAMPPSINLWGGIRYGSAGKNGLDSLGNEEIASLKRLFDQYHINPRVHEGDNATEEDFKNQASGMTGVLHISTHGLYFPFDRDHRKDSLPGIAAAGDATDAGIAANDADHGSIATGNAGRDGDAGIAAGDADHGSIAAGDADHGSIAAGDAGPAGFLAANADPLYRCGLALSGVNHYWTKGLPLPGREDGFLTGGEVSMLDLHHVQLVTLSACETGLGDITDDEGNLGLQRAFKLAGAENLLVSLWQVDQALTTHLLTLFYGNWLKGMSLSEALRAAEQALAGDNTRKSPLTPYRWAAFELIE